jgi:hypothetical protein
VPGRWRPRHATTSGGGARGGLGYPGGDGDVQ